MFAVDVSNLSCEAGDMPALHRKSARMCIEGAGSTPSSAGASRPADSREEKLYSNADVSKMVKEAVSHAVSHTKDKYEKILQEKLAGLPFHPTSALLRNLMHSSPPLSEQYQQFVRFNEDYLSRAMKDSPHDYIS